MMNSPGDFSTPQLISLGFVSEIKMRSHPF